MYGVYVLKITLENDSRLKIGALGVIDFRAATYLYVGSAQKGLENRIQRHLGTNKKKFWHIDYLLISKESRIKQVFFQIASKKQECRTAKKLLAHGTPVPGFGCSDCKCSSHLIKISEYWIATLFADWKIWEFPETR